MNECVELMNRLECHIDEATVDGGPTNWDAIVNVPTTCPHGWMALQVIQDALYGEDDSYGVLSLMGFTDSGADFLLTVDHDATATVMRSLARSMVLS